MKRPKIPIKRRGLKVIVGKIVNPLCPKCNGTLDLIDGNYHCKRCGWQTRVKPSTVGWLQKIWYKLNGNKLGIGLVITGLGWLLKTSGIPYVGDAALAFGGALTIGGGGHKVSKKKNKIEAEKGGGKIPWAKILFKIIADFILKKLKKKGGE